MTRFTCPYRQEMMSRLIGDEHTLAPSAADLAHAKTCPVCAKALTALGSLDSSLSDGFNEMRNQTTPIPPSPALEKLLLPTHQPNWAPWSLALAAVVLVVLLAIVLLLPNRQAPAIEQPIPVVPIPRAAPVCHIASGKLFISGSQTPVDASMDLLGKKLMCPGKAKIVHRNDVALTFDAASFKVAEEGISLDAGTVDCDVPIPGTKFAVSTRMARVSVTGTLFRVALASENLLEVKCFAGQVVVGTIQGERLRLGRGEVARLDRHGKKIEPPASTSISVPPASSAAPVSIASGLPDQPAPVEEFSEELRLAIKKQSYERVCELVGLLPQVNVRDQRSWTPLHEAAYRERPDVITLLLDRGADVNIQTDDGWTPLAETAYMGCLESAQIFLDHGALVDTTDCLGWTPLFRAAQAGQIEMMTFLLKHGANLATTDYKGSFLIHRCAEGNQASATQLLLSHGADANCLNQRQETPLHIAAQERAQDTIEVLLAAGAHINARDSGGRTPLHLAASKGFSEIVRLLVEQEADIETQDNEGRSPLESAAFNGQDETVKLLKSFGARSH